MLRLILFLNGIFLFTASFAANNYFRVVNNLPVPLKVSIHPSVAGVKSSCGGDLDNIDLGPRSQSCALEFTVLRQTEEEAFKNSGLLTLAKKEDSASFCTYHYSYSYNPRTPNYTEQHSESLTLQGCQGSLLPEEVSFVNNHTQRAIRPLIDMLAYTEYREKSEKMTESIALSDCGGEGVDNCLVVSPALAQPYLSKGSSLSQALHLQLALDRHEPLNFAQFIGSHNAAISRHYTSSSMDYNLSHADPDHFLPLTDQLNSGVRLLELDLQWSNNAVTLCHDDVDRDPAGVFCEDNYPLSTAITEIRSWVENHPEAFLFIYLDVHLPLAGHVSDLDRELENLEPYLFTPKMVTQDFGLTGNTLPAYRLSQSALTEKYKKNIIVTNDNDTEDLINSRYVFVKTQDSPSAPLPEMSLDSFLAPTRDLCADGSKYANMEALFGKADPEHYNLLRLNEVRTVVAYLDSIRSRGPEQYHNYFTTRNLPSILRCPINIFSTSMIGYTCQDQDCARLSTEPKLYSFLWSWGLGYPLIEGGGKLAYINPQTGHFENEPLEAKDSYQVLCHRSQPLRRPAALRWYLAELKAGNPDKLVDQAEGVCRQAGGHFAVPTTSYWMSDVLDLIHAEQDEPRPVLVNYQYRNGEWLMNETLNERSLAR